MAENLRANVLENCRISPPPDTKAELSLELTFFDMPWVDVHMMHSLLFYEFPHPKSHMMKSIIPNLKSSLSLTLKHYLPLAGNLVYPSNSGKPFLQYVAGNSVSLDFAESSHDFDYLKGFQARNANDFYHLLPQMPPAVKLSDSTLFPVLAIQVTMFPDHGISIGFTSHHVVCDGNTLVGFMKAWGSINQLERDPHLQAGKTLSFLDRNVIKDLYGLGEQFWNAKKGKIQLEKILQPDQNLIFSNQNRVRATFVVNQTDIQKLKNLILQNSTTPVHASSFTAVCAYVWTCIVKTRTAMGDKADDDEVECFITAIDCRARLNPPIPFNFFGNCIAPCIIKAKHGKLISKEGFVYSALLIGETIYQKVNSEEGVLKDAKSWIKEVESLNVQRLFGVSGSPKFDTYEIDYGWGSPEKCEIVHIDNGGMSLNKSRKFEGGLDVGLTLSKAEMEAFAAVFVDGLKIV